MHPSSTQPNLLDPPLRTNNSSQIYAMVKLAVLLRQPKKEKGEGMAVDGDWFL